jgi:LemA protein
MGTGTTALLVILAIIVFVIFYFVSIYNKLIQLKNRFKNAFAQIDVQLKRRYDLIPNLVETAKGYLKHERQVLEAVIKARNQASSAMEKAAADPGNSEAMQLSEELTTTENKVSFARQAFNDAVMAYNTAREIFPNNIVANMFAFKEAQLFEIKAEAEREAPKVSF